MSIYDRVHAPLIRAEDRGGLALMIGNCGGTARWAVMDGILTKIDVLERNAALRRRTLRSCLIDAYADRLIAAEKAIDAGKRSVGNAASRIT